MIKLPVSIHLAALVFLALLCTSSTAQADALKVTLVARECSDYPYVMANRARNNIMESLKDLGPDSVYQSGEMVSKGIEESIAVQDAHCVPLNDWRFSLGNGISPTKDTGAFGELSRVGTLVRVSGATRNNVPVRDSNGHPTGEKIDGAVTIELNATEKALAEQGRLTVQGGEPGSPLLGSQVLGFATLRCGNDNLNADNVEYARFPSPTKHIFCYAYYINPAPTAATIIISKRVENSSATDVAFSFGGNTSFTSNGTFSLVKGGSISFDRAAVTGGTPEWVVFENTSALPSRYSFSRIECASTLGSVSTISGSQVSIRLLGGDTVRCTFINRILPDISPILECTARSAAQSYTAYWGYLNRGTSLAAVPPGSLNAFSPPPQNRGQPYSFRVGRVTQAFSVNHTGGPLTWSLTGRTATSSSASVQRCEPTCIVPPIVRVPQCDGSLVIDGSLSGTLNNGGTLSGVSWTTTCPGVLSNTSSLSPTLTVDYKSLPSSGAKCKVSLSVTDDTRYGSSNPDELQTKTCTTKVVIPPCGTDCAGIPNGNTNIDECGVCGGDNSTCTDCAGVPNGGAAVDQCGVCSGENQSCADCAGVPNGGAVVDTCGVCGGDGSSCAATCPAGIDACGICGGNGSSCKDCAGVPNGGALIDACGVCGGDGSSCSGVCRSTVDQCGVCGGNNSTCLDCAGVPNGSAKVDVCGVCGGDGSSCASGCPAGVDACGVCGGNGSSCKDCAGIANGKSEIDECGVCGGDGSSCSMCISAGAVPPADRTALKQIGSDLKLLVKNAGRYTKEAIQCDPSSEKALKRRIQRITELFLTLKAVIQEDLTTIKNQCANSECAEVSIVSIKSDINLLAKMLRELSRTAQLIVAKCRAPIASDSTARDSKALLADIEKNLAEIPDTGIACTPG